MSPGACGRRSASLDDRDIPVVGLAAAFVFAAQMLNFPVASGTSGHFFGGVLAAVLVGPYAGALAVTVVLVVQAVLFADGGLSALGLNIVNMALVGAFAGYGIFLLIRLRARVLGTAAPAVTSSAGLAAFAAPRCWQPSCSSVEYAIGGNDAVSVGSVAGAMIGVHALIGIGEGIITALAVGSVMAMRPDLVYGARGVAPGPRIVASPSRR